MLAVFWFCIVAGSAYWCILVQFFGFSAFGEIVSLSRKESKDHYNMFTGKKFEYLIYFIIQLYLLPRLVFPKELLVANGILLER